MRRVVPATLVLLAATAQAATVLIDDFSSTQESVAIISGGSISSSTSTSPDTPSGAIGPRQMSVIASAPLPGGTMPPEKVAGVNVNPTASPPRAAFLATGMETPGFVTTHTLSWDVPVGSEALLSDVGVNNASDLRFEIVVLDPGSLPVASQSFSVVLTDTLGRQAVYQGTLAASDIPPAGSGSTFVLELTYGSGNSNFEGNSVDLIQFSATIDGAGAQTTALEFGAISVVPEPAVAVLGLLGVVGLMRRRR